MPYLARLYLARKLERLARDRRSSILNPMPVTTNKVLKLDMKVSFFHFLTLLINAAASRHQKDLQAALAVIFSAKIFAEKRDDESLSAFLDIHWMAVEANLFGTGDSKTMFEAVTDFLTSVVENVPVSVL